MSKVFAVASPLFNSKYEVQSYYLHGKNSSKLFDAESLSMVDPLQSPTIDIVGEMGTEPFAGDYPLFVEINEYQLLSGLPIRLGLKQNQIIPVFGSDIQFNGAIYQKCDELKKQGYEIAAKGNIPSISVDLFFDLFDYLILDFKSPSFSSELLATRPYIFKIKPIINNIPDVDSFESLSKLHGALFTGDFYSAPITKGATTLTPLKMNALHLLGQISEDDFDLTSVAEIIEHDAALSLSLLRFINSAGGFRGTKRVESIRQAVAIMGQTEVKRWSLVAITAQLGEDRPSEVTRLSLLRGKFAENLAGMYGLGMFRSSLFITGLFSLLDVILQKPMAQALEDIAVDSRIFNALANDSGEFAPIMELITSFGSNNWYSLAVNLYKNKLEPDSAAQAFLDAYVWYRELLERMEEED